MRHSLKRSAAGWLFCAAAVVSLGVAPAFAADTNSEAAPSETQKSEQTVSQQPVLDLSGFKAFVDPETGELRAPTQEEADALAKALRVQHKRLEARSLQAPTIEALTLDNGVEAESVLLDLNSVNVSIARVNADGNVEFECGLNHDHTSHETTTEAGDAPADM